MKQIKKTLTFVILVSILTSCTSVKLTDNWKSENFEKTKKERILVVARAIDMDVRKSYEQKIASELRANGMNAIEAYKEFPSLKENKDRSEEEKKQLVKMFKEKGINGVLLAALKDKKVLKSSDEKIPKQQLYLGTGNIGKYGVSFTSYYNTHSVEYLTRDLIPEEDLGGSEVTIPLTSIIYVFEAMLYDLTLKEEKQLTGVFLIEVTDPSSASQVLKKVAKTISKQFE